MNYSSYSEYKDSKINWLGDIPKNWDLCRLKYLFEIMKRPPEKDDEIVTAFRDGEVTLRSNRRLDGFTNSVKENGYQGIRKGDLVIHAMDAFAGAIGVSDSNGKSTPVYSVCRPRNENINAWYFGKLLRTMALSGYINSLAKGIRERSTEFRWAEAGNVKLPVPDLKEQIAINAFIEREAVKMDKLIAEKEKLITLLKEKRQAIISSGVTKGLDPSVPMKDSGKDLLGILPAHWSITRLGYESWVRARLGWKGLKADEYVDDGYILLATPNIKGHQIDFENVNCINEFRYEESPEIMLRVGDVLLAKDGSTLGTVNIVRSLPRPATVNSSIAVITPSGRLLGTYLYYLFQSFYMEHTIQRIKDGMGVPHLFQEDLNKFYIPLPTRDEQSAIVAFLDEETFKIDKLIAYAQQAIDLLKERRSAIISAAVSGKIDVRDLVEWR